MEFAKYLPDGQMVCGKHSRIPCGQCCVDFDDEIFRQAPDEIEDDDRVFVLGTGVNRFVPQGDEQVLGPAKIIGIKRSEASQLPLVNFQRHVCTKCDLTWLVGEAGVHAAHSHPSHHTLYHEWTNSTRRSLLVHVDGACADNGNANARAGVGFFFGPGSKYYVSQASDTSSSSGATNQKAELDALRQAMRVVRLQVIPERATLVKGNKDMKHLRLILATDSSYAVECMCAYWKNWTVSGSVLRNQRGQVIANSNELFALQQEVEALSHVGVQVVYYHVPRELNPEADKLAKECIKKRSDGVRHQTSEKETMHIVRSGHVRTFRN
jgi:ribonuclease HI